MKTKAIQLANICTLLFSLFGFSKALDSLKTIEKKNKKFIKEHPNNIQISAGSITIAVLEGNSIAANLKSQVITVGNYFMKKGEVTNGDYLEFLDSF